MKRLSKNILTMTAIGTLMFSLSAKAYDAPELSFYPVASWDITDIAGVDQSSKTCLMMNEYNNGYVLQFQGSQGKIESLSVDFRQNAFEVGQSLTVRLTLPGKKSVDLPATAFSADVLSLNMGGQDDFFGMLRQANALDVDIDGNNFRFFMTGFANAKRSYDHCMGKVQEPANMVESAPQETMEELNVARQEPVRSAPSPLMQDMSQDAQEKYAEELSVILQEPTEKVSAELQKALDNQNDTLMDQDALALKSEPGKRYTETLAEQMGTPKEKKVSAAPPPVSAPMVVEETVQEMEVHQAETLETPVPPKEEITWNGPAQSQKVEITTLDDMPEPAQDDLVEVVVQEETEEDDLIQDIADFVKGDSQAEADTQLASVETPEIATPMPEMEVREPVTENYRTPEPKVTKEVFRSEADFTDMPVKEVASTNARPPFSDRYASAASEDMKRMKSRLERLKRENDALNAELEAALRAGEKERLEISSDNWNLEQATMRFNEAERQLANLGQEIQKERAQCAYEKKELEMMLFDPEVTEEAQLARLASLEDKIQKLEMELEKQAKDYERQMQALRSRASQ